MKDVNINNDPFEGPQLEALRQHQIAKTGHVKMVLQGFANPPIAEGWDAGSLTAHGIGLTYQPTLNLMWVTQRGAKIGPAFSTALTFAV